MTHLPDRRSVLLGLAASAATPLLMSSPADASSRLSAPLLSVEGHGADPAQELGPALRPEPVPPGGALSPEELAGLTHSSTASMRAAPDLAGAVVGEDFPLVDLPVGLLPYHRSTPWPLPDTGLHDSTGVRLVRVGGVLYNHPVAQAQFGINLLESHRITGAQVYLDLAQRQAQRLLDRRNVVSDAWWYPYPFRYQVHSRFEVYPAPWYSMMAQGQALSLFVRLYLTTSNVAWQQAADATYASFTQPAVAGRPWGVWSKDGLLWLEEYPSPVAIRGDRTFNGHTFSSFGLYDYWRLTKADAVATLLRAALTTTRDAAMIVRHRGWRSCYCCAHLLDANPYHTTHIGQFLKAYAITTDPVFAGLADLFHRDYPIESGPGTVRFAAGRHTGYTFDANGAVLATKTITLLRSSRAPCLTRGRVMRRTGIWYPISGGSLAGYQVQEVPGVRYRIGTCCQLGYPIQRAATVLVDAPRAYTIGASGAMGRVTTDLARGSVVAIDSRATLNGVEHLRLADGDYAGRWIGATLLAL